MQFLAKSEATIRSEFSVVPSQLPSCIKLQLFSLAYYTFYMLIMLSIFNTLSSFAAFSLSP